MPPPPVSVPRSPPGQMNSPSLDRADPRRVSETAEGRVSRTGARKRAEEALFEEKERARVTLSSIAGATALPGHGTLQGVEGIKRRGASGWDGREINPQETGHYSPEPRAVLLCLVDRVHAAGDRNISVACSAVSGRENRYPCIT